jgi:hypothetical protein
MTDHYFVFSPFGRTCNECERPAVMEVCDKIEELPVHHNGILWQTHRAPDARRYCCEDHLRPSIILFRDYTEDQLRSLCEKHGVPYIQQESLDEINARSTAEFLIQVNAEKCTRGFLDAEMDELYRDREKD